MTERTNRRGFFRDVKRIVQVTAVTGFGLTAAGALAYSLAENEARSQDEAWNTAKEYQLKYPQTNTYRSLKVDSTKESRCTQLNGPEGGHEINMVFSEGAKPEVSFIDERGVEVYSKTPDDTIEILPGVKVDVNKFLTDIPEDGETLVVNRREVETVIVNADSWGRWHNPGAILQEFLARSGYNTRVVNVSVSSAGPLDQRDTVERIKKHHPSMLSGALIVQMFQPGTDFEDARTYPNAQTGYWTAAQGKIEEDLVQHTLAITRRSVGPLYNVSLPGDSGTPAPLLHLQTEETSPGIGELYGEVAKAYKTMLELSGDAQVMFLGLASNVLRPGDYAAQTEFFEKLARDAGFDLGLASSIHESFPPNLYERSWHPDRDGAFFIARYLVEKITGKRVSAEVEQQVWDRTRERATLLERGVYPAMKASLKQPLQSPEK